MKRSVVMALALAIGGIGGAPVSSVAEGLPVTASEGKPDPLKCRRVTRRFSICGDTNFKNKVVAGFGVHFHTIDPSGRLRTVGVKHRIQRGSQ